LETFIRLIKKTQPMQQEANRLLQEGKVIAFVPTMGYFHEGHLALMREGRKHGDALIVSIFVNPAQFAPTEDFKAYPRDLNRDARMAKSVGVDVIFAPEADVMYDKGHETYVNLEGLPLHLCGLSRPGHFRGVVTVVAKLFNIVKPHVALFGEKDYQQLLVIRRLVRDLNFDIRIIGVPTLREADGLAMSSRNSYLSRDERRSALSLHKSMQLAQGRVAQGIRDASQLIAEASGLIGSHPHTRIDYVTLCDPETLEDVERIDKPSLMALAVWIGHTRLIDNAVLTP
jgi:pantoate--beta-alanine ligase